jgi:hypothetical protein
LKIEQETRSRENDTLNPIGGAVGKRGPKGKYAMTVSARVPILLFNRLIEVSEKEVRPIASIARRWMMRGMIAEKRG